MEQKQRGSHNCWTCGKGGQLRQCGHCMVATYCSRSCQTQGWKQGHKRKCPLIKAEHGMRGRLRPLHKGTKVSLTGLVKKAELNGQEGTLLKFDQEKKRWGVQLKDGTKILIQPANLLLPKQQPIGALQEQILQDIEVAKLVDGGECTECDGLIAKPIDCRLNCGHIFHRQCVKSKRQTGKSGIFCPTCKDWKPHPEDTRLQDLLQHLEEKEFYTREDMSVLFEATDDLVSSAAIEKLNEKLNNSIKWYNQDATGVIHQCLGYIFQKYHEDTYGHDGSLKDELQFIDDRVSLAKRSGLTKAAHAKFDKFLNKMRICVEPFGLDLRNEIIVQITGVMAPYVTPERPKGGRHPEDAQYAALVLRWIGTFLTRVQ